MDRTESTASDRSDVTLTDGQGQQNPLGQEVVPEVTDDKSVEIPQLSWVMTVLILSVVSVVRIEYVPHHDGHPNQLVCSWSLSLPIGWW